MPAYDFDLFVIGAGSGGVRAARLAGALGKRVAVAEDNRLGGTCVNRGCIPKKLYSYASHFAEDFEDAAGYGWTVGERKFDWPTLVAAKEKELARLNAIYGKVLNDNKVTVILGRAVMRDAHTVEVAGKSYSAETILIGTGGKPSHAQFPGHELTISSDEAFDLPALPKSIVIAGAGYIALEFASIFHGLGVDTTVVYRGAELLRHFDADIRRTVYEEMQKKGVKFRLETIFDRIEKTPEGLRMTTNHGDTLVAEQVMMAIGRKPNTHGIGLMEAGVECNRDGAIVVGIHSQTSVPNIYAIGDVTDRLNLTPVAIYEAHCLIETLYRNNPMRPDHRDVPTAVFSNPPAASVGMSEEDACAEFGAIDVYRSTFKPLKHTLSGRDARTMIKLVVEKKTGQVRGAHMAGTDAAEIIQGFAVAVKAGLTKAQFDATMGIHPTSAEEFVQLRTPVSSS
ncbi:MAG TPA: glutathione-disulfide reductase [Alphaproteobacteria bacterium]|jgi:glutathione reductase (NADPH)